MSASSAGLVGPGSVDNYILLAMDSGCVLSNQVILSFEATGFQCLGSETLSVTSG